MKIILDEDTPAPLGSYLSGHEVETVPRMGWAGTGNGELLALVAEHGFEVFLTCDRNLQYQQNLATRPFAVVVLAVPNKNMATLLPLVPEVLRVFSAAEPGHVYQVGK